MEWLTQPVKMWQVMLWSVTLIAIVGVFLWREWQDVKRQIEHNETHRYQVERYINERLSEAREDINGIDLRTFDLEIQAKRLQTPLWKRWLRKMAA